MSKADHLSAERQVLRDELRKLEKKALQGKDRTQAIAEANRRLRQTALVQLSSTTVGGWFEKGTPAKDFEALWALVEVLLEWAEPPSAGSPRNNTRSKVTDRRANSKQLWKIRWEQAKGTKKTSPAPIVQSAIHGYLKALRDAGRQHPYADALVDSVLPALADVYVPQQAALQIRDGQASQFGSSFGDAMSVGSQVRPLLAADEIFLADGGICVLQAAPGTGKSTLLRTHLISSANCWLENKAGKTIPVMVRADALATAAPLPAALSKAATGELKRFGLLDELPTTFFRRPPRVGVAWLVLVDGLDEIPDAGTRAAVLQTLASAVRTEPGLYRFVVATRPLPDGELHALGPHVTSFELQPFSPDDLLTYATQWFRTLDDPSRHAEAFLTGLKRSRLDVLARTPLMASMLCQLYAADPHRPLPDGRTGAYQAFVELIYEQNAHKNVKDTHDKAIRRLKERHQIPSQIQTAEQAAQQVRDHLAELIDHLAYERINGNTAAAVQVVASHLHARCPDKVKAHLWDAFLSDLLRPTGLLMQHANDFEFLHQTLLEYHAARHATRNKQARAQLLRDLITSSNRLGNGRRVPPALDPSYVGFLLDGLLSPQDGITSQTVDYLEELTHHGVDSVCSFLTQQVDLRTGLPPDATAAQLIRFAEGPTHWGRMMAPQALPWVEGYREEGATRLAALADDADLDDHSRVVSARTLAKVDGYLDDGAARLAALARDTTLYADFRAEAGSYLAKVDGYLDDGAARLAALADDTTLDIGHRVHASCAMAEVGGYRDEAAARLAAFAADITLDFEYRAFAARSLAEVDGYQHDAATWLTAFAENVALGDRARVQAAQGVAGMLEYRHEGAARLAAFADDTTLDDRARVQAAQILAGILEYRHEGAAQLTAFADDTTLDDIARVQAAQGVAGMLEYRHEGAARLAALADDTTLDDFARVLAGSKLLQVDGCEDDAAGRLRAFADDTTLDDRARVWAAQNLARMQGGGQEGTARLRALADDSALDDRARVQAARKYAQVDGYQQEGAAQLAGLAGSTALDDRARVQAARDLARVDGYRQEGVALLAGLAGNTDLDDLARVQAASDVWAITASRDGDFARLMAFAEDASLDDLARVQAAHGMARVDECQDDAAALLAAFADDTNLDDQARVRAAQILTGLDGYWEEGAARLTAFTDNTDLDDLARVQAAQDLAWMGNWEGGAARLTAFTNDTTLDDLARVRAAEILAHMEGHWEKGAARLTAFVEDTGLDDLARVQAAQGMAWLGHQSTADIVEIGNYTDLDDGTCVRAADTLTIAGHRENGAARLAVFAADVALDERARLRAAQSLTELTNRRNWT